jgi:hypothetical protein
LAGREKPRRWKARNITQNPASAVGTASVLGKTISADSDKNPSLFDFFISASSKEEGILPKACFFVLFFTILDRHAMARC